MTDVNLLTAFVDFGIENLSSFDSQVGVIENRLANLTNTPVEILVAFNSASLQGSIAVVEGSITSVTAGLNSAASATSRIDQEMASTVVRASALDTSLSSAAVAASSIQVPVIDGSQGQQLADGLRTAAAAEEQLVSETVRADTAMESLNTSVQAVESSVTQAAARARQMRSTFDSIVPPSNANQFFLGNADQATRSFTALSTETRRVNNLLFETANIAQDAQFGFQAVANNIPGFIRSFGSFATEAGGASSALGALSVQAGALITSIPGLAVVLGNLGIAAVVGGVAGLVGRFDELSDAVSGLGGVAAGVFGQMASALAPIGDAIRENTIDPIIRFTNDISGIIADFFDIPVDVSGLSSVRLARQEIARLTSTAEDASPAVLALEADMLRLQRGIAGGTNDNVTARRELAQLGQQLEQLRTAGAVNEINAYTRSLQENNQTEFESRLSRTIQRFRELSIQVENGADPTQLFALGAQLQNFAQTDAARTIASINQEFDSLTESQRVREIDRLQQRLTELTRINGLDGVNIDFEISQLAGQIAELTGRNNTITFEAARTAEIRTEIESLTRATRTWSEEIQEVVEALGDGVSLGEIDFDAAVNLLDRQLDSVFSGRVDTLERELASVIDNANIEQLASAQSGTVEELDAILDVTQAESDADAIRSRIAALGEERNALLEEQTELLRQSTSSDGSAVRFTTVRTGAI